MEMSFIVKKQFKVNNEVSLSIFAALYNRALSRKQNRIQTTILLVFSAFPNIIFTNLSLNNVIIYTILNIDNNFTLPLNFLASINLTYAWKGDYQIIRIKNYSSLN